MRHIELLTTGGTIEKVYDEFTGALVNRGSIVQRMLRRLRLEDTDVRMREILAKDSLQITKDERLLIVKAVRDAAASKPAPAGVVVLHGTDTLCETGELLHEILLPASSPGPDGGGAESARRRGPALEVPIILTGAMRPFEMKRSDALQNLTEALLAASLLPPGVYFVGHGRALVFPGVVKNREKGTFVKNSAD